MCWCVVPPVLCTTHMYPGPCGMCVVYLVKFSFCSLLLICTNRGLWHWAVAVDQNSLYPALNNVCWMCVVLCWPAVVCVSGCIISAKRQGCGAGQVKWARELWRVPPLAVSQHRSLHVNTAMHSWAGLIEYRPLLWAGALICVPACSVLMVQRKCSS